MSAFPAELPPLLDIPEVIQAHDWQAFSQLTHMHNHWDRPNWPAGRRSYHWMLSFHDADTVRRLAKQCQAQLPRSGFDFVPLHLLHVTIGRIAFTDDLPLITAIAVADEARLACERLPPFRLTIGPLAGSQGAVRFSVAPWSHLFELHRRLTAATRAVLGAHCVMNTARLRPHLSIAYANTDIPLALLLPVLERLRAVPPVDVMVSSVELVELRREDRLYQYEQLRRLQLAG